LVAGVLGTLAVIEALSILTMIPLKERIPYIVEINKTTSEVIVKDNLMKKFTPSDANKAFFIRGWVENMFTLDAARTKDYLLPAAALSLRGPAVEQYKALLLKDKPIESLVENPLLSRHVKNININFVPGADVAIVRFVLETSSGQAITSANKSASIKFILVEKEVSETNPIGFFITDVNVKDDF
jgi:type IV secretory pathway component VirB8